jgi:hypothetical protein
VTNIFNFLVRGECVKVLDYRPSQYVLSANGHDEKYMVGIIRSVSTMGEEDDPIRCYSIECVYDSEWCYVNGELKTRVGQLISVPISIPFDYPNRILKV